MGYATIRGPVRGATADTTPKKRLLVVMEDERFTSDAEVFPDGIRTLKLGKVVGVTT